MKAVICCPCGFSQRTRACTASRLESCINTKLQQNKESFFTLLSATRSHGQNSKNVLLEHRYFRLRLMFLKHLGNAVKKMLRGKDRSTHSSLVRIVCHNEAFTNLLKTNKKTFTDNYTKHNKALFDCFTWHPCNEEQMSG